MSNEKTLIVFDSQGMQRTITRMASEIIENYNGIYDLVLIGLKTRGEFLANRLYDEIKKIDNIN
ncbi:MAG: bifunctional pyr operon transcriptional regulator/uracil phosphoribosyltransferase, partial [Candidatus Cloacimonadota bacterium]|nr:bifunctional pyr operon transcriptional regulator/uracil phosphoribosyltransferase [Candidatus Cloacimonadota bacterium]